MLQMSNSISASEMGKRSWQARVKKFGSEEKAKKQMREYGKLGGKPKKPQTASV